MNAPRLAVATTVLLLLCGTAGAETMDEPKTDPLAATASAARQPGERAAMPWTPERLAKAQPKPAPDVDPASVRAAAGNFRSGEAAGPEADTAPAVLAAGDQAISGQVTPAGEKAGDPWTPERMRKAKPMPLPVLPEDSPIKPKNR